MTIGCGFANRLWILFGRLNSKNKRTRRAMDKAAIKIITSLTSFLFVFSFSFRLFLLIIPGVSFSSLAYFNEFSKYLL